MWVLHRPANLIRLHLLTPVFSHFYLKYSFSFLINFCHIARASSLCYPVLKLAQFYYLLYPAVYPAHLFSFD